MENPDLTGRRVLVTAGPTRVPIDAVRHISNVSSGRTGLEIARAAAQAGAEVTLLLGPGRATAASAGRLQVIDFVTFDDLHFAVREQVGSRSYDALIHTAAVSDYRPVAEEPGKIPSNAEELVIRLRRTPKIVDEVRALDPHITLVKFKLEVGRTEAELLEIARTSRDRSDADFIVANDLTRISDTAHPALILDRERVIAQVGTTNELAEAVTGVLAAHFAAGPPAAGRVL
ncbi:MAG: hypothetical protein K0Q72_3653 [Armatimonadetes bacterium]|jgi:phosphopantothenoylcysteine synthetase/decarboxylase|nr:hypothetical protein [Armatimonadota bacterium]